MGVKKNIMGKKNWERGEDISHQCDETGEKMLQSGISVVLLAYREEENLKILIPQIIDVLSELDNAYEIIVVDTQEPLDNTHQICKKFNCVYVNQKYPGFGGAFRTAIECAKYDKFLILDSDGSHPPKYIMDIYDKFTEGGYDVVIGSRYVKGGVTQDSYTSIMMSRLLNTVFRIALGIHAHDISTDYRLYKTQQLKNVVLENENYDVLQEVLLKLKLQNGNLRIGEVPITFQKRMYGESKRRLFEFIISYIKSLFRLLCLRFPLLQNLFLYGLIGVGGAGVELGVFSILVRMDILAEAANIIGAVCGFCVTFTMNTFCNFKKRDQLFRRFLSYGSVCIAGMIFSSVCIHCLKYAMDIYILKFILLCIVSMGQFILNKKFTYCD